MKDERNTKLRLDSAHQNQAAERTADVIRGFIFSSFIPHPSSFFWFVLITALTVGLRFYGMGNACYWLDEFDSLECSTGRGLAHVALPANQWENKLPNLTSLQGAPPWTRIWTSLSLDNHPPLYFILLRWWRDAFGDSEVATRMMSVIFSVAAAALFYFIVQTQMPAEAALWATGMMALASSQVYFSHQVRGYALWNMLAMLGLLAIVRIERSDRPRAWLVVLFLAALAMPLTHYFAFASVLSLLLIVLVFLRGRRRIHAIACIAGACAVYALVWGRFLWQQRLVVGINNQWQVDDSSHHYLMTVERYCLLPVRWLSETTVSTLSAPGGIIVACVMVAIFVAMIWTVGRKREAWFWLIFLAPLAVGVAGLDLVHGQRFLTIARYTFVAGPGVFALFGLCVGGRARIFGRVLCAGAIVLSVATLRSVYADDQEWRLIAGVLQHQMRPGDRIIYASGGREAWWAGSLYLGVNFYAPDLPAEKMILTDEHAPALAGALQSGHTTWLLDANIHESSTAIFPGAKIVDYAVLPNVAVVSQLTR